MIALHFSTLELYLIIIGLICVIIMFKNGNNITAIIILFISIYFTLCFVTSPFMRNIVIRYFFPVNIILTLTAAYFIVNVLKRDLEKK